MRYGRHLPAGDILNTQHLAILGIVLGLGTFSQTNAQTTVATAGPAPTFGATLTTRTVEAINYRHHGAPTKLDFRGTDLMPAANGVATVKSNRGSIAIEAEFGELQRPTALGAEYLTYVLWAISPEGSAVNLGEVLVGGNHRSKLNVTTGLQAFALIVTAEPYFAVHQPSNVVVLENVARIDTKGTSETVNAKFELMERGSYIPTGYKFDPIVLDAKLPLEFLEARNALRIAHSEGAERYASDSYQHASELMDTANRYATTKHSSKKELIATSREAVQTAEDARTIAVKKMDDERRASERQDSSDALARSQVRTDDAIRQKELAQSDTARAQSDTARAQSDATRAQLDSQAQAEDATRQKELAKSDAAKVQAESQAQADNATRQKEEAQSDTAKARSDMAADQAASAASQAASASEVAAAHADADQSRLATQLAQQSESQAISDKAAMRALLSEQLNKVLQTRDGARGLIVSMSDVLFETGQFSLKAGAREKLAKIAGILIAYPTLDIEAGGYTDNVGGDEMNQKLSENRAGAVRDYLVEQGVATESVRARGFGNASPVASNDNSAGRQENRRVELVVSGEAIGSPANVTTGSLR
jgi:outer membrane protein OmpA-like peptidoglycan-associated protein